jgi:hypothetical protein
MHALAVGSKSRIDAGSSARPARRRCRRRAVADQSDGPRQRHAPRERDVVDLADVLVRRMKRVTRRAFHRCVTAMARGRRPQARSRLHARRRRRSAAACRRPRTSRTSRASGWERSPPARGHSDGDRRHQARPSRRSAPRSRRRRGTATHTVPSLAERAPSRMACRRALPTGARASFASSALTVFTSGVHDEEAAVPPSSASKELDVEFGASGVPMTVIVRVRAETEPAESRACTVTW